VEFGLASAIGSELPTYYEPKLLSSASSNKTGYGLNGGNNSGGFDTVMSECSITGCTNRASKKHRGYTRFNIQIPFTGTTMANVDELMNRTEILRVTDTDQVTLNDVEGL